MRKLVAAAWMICLMFGCQKQEPRPEPPVAAAEAPTPAPEPNFVHRVEWRGQTLGQIARWYTGKFENWKKLVRPVNPDLQRCCATLQVGREVSIPRELVVRTEPMPRPQVTARPAKPPQKAEPEKPSAETAEEPSEEPPPAAGLSLSEAPAEEPPPTAGLSLSEAPPPPAEKPSAEPPAAATSASGKVNFKGQSWDVADAIAYPGDDKTVEVALSSKPFDRKDIVKDGKVDSFDVMRHQMSSEASTITLKIDADDTMSCLDYSLQGGGGSSCGSAQSQGLKLDKRSRDAIAGSFAFTDGEDKVDARFNLPITRTVKRAGQPLPAGGGEPGKAVLANFAAARSGDLEKLKALSPPEKRQQMESVDASEKEMMLGFLKATTPTGVKILGGTVDGDSALVDFQGKSDGQKVKGTVEVERIDGRWYVESVNTSQ